MKNILCTKQEFEWTFKKVDKACTKVQLHANSYIFDKTRLRGSLGDLFNYVKTINKHINISLYFLRKL